ncbi:MAG: hypothetical protein EKK62_16820 [Acidimicrobiia bacterium]|nr:MAG: hypothetical protein EKK62_16820 [Acidimicrobiia bacterium]
MPAATKFVNVIGALAKLESTYGTAVALTSTSDGFRLQYPDRNGIPIQIDYAFDGKTGVNPGNLSDIPLSAPGGKSFSWDAPIRFKGAGAAYSASVVPPDAHLALQISGFDAAVTTTTTVEKWTYTPQVVTSAYKSATFGLYARGELWPVKGVVADWSFTFDNPGPPTHSFAMRGIANSDVTDVTLPSITYTGNSVDAPNANGITAVIGSFTTNAVVYSGSFRLNRTIEPRVALTSGTGHEGFVPGGYSPELTIQVEDTAFVGSPYHTSAGLDPIKLREAATKITVSVQFGSTQYNRWKLTLSNAQLYTVQPASNGRVACWDLTFKPSSSTPIALDDLSIVFD